MPRRCLYAGAVAIPRADRQTVGSVTANWQRALPVVSGTDASTAEADQIASVRQTTRAWRMHADTNTNMARAAEAKDTVEASARDPSSSVPAANAAAGGGGKCRRFFTAAAVATLCDPCKRG